MPAARSFVADASLRASARSRTLDWAGFRPSSRKLETVPVAPVIRIVRFMRMNMLARARWTIHDSLPTMSNMLDNPRADLNAVNVFVHVVKAKTFRAAARELGVPKSTVSFRVAQLEDRLGARLLERTTRSLRLTDAGAAYYARVAPALEAMRDAEDALESREAGPSGVLRVSATFEGGQFMLAPAFAEYMRRHPDVRLQIVLTDRMVDLIEEHIDVAVRSGSLPAPA